jgi:hypothetical protein
MNSWRNQRFVLYVFVGVVELLLPNHFFGEHG